MDPSDSLPIPSEHCNLARITGFMLPVLVPGYLSRINSPNTLGIDCGFVENAVGLALRECGYGLPPFIQSFFFLSADFYWDEPACDGNVIQFHTSASDTPDSVKWTFPDGSHSELMDPSYLFPGPGLYGVSVLVYIYGQSKSVNHFVRIHEKTEMALGNDTTICKSEAFYIDPGPYYSYLWQDGSTMQTILADTTGWYRCEVGNEWGCTAIDSMYITVNPNPEISAGPGITIPEGEAATLGRVRFGRIRKLYIPLGTGLFTDRPERIATHYRPYDNNNPVHINSNRYDDRLYQ